MGPEEGRVVEEDGVEGRVYHVVIVVVAVMTTTPPLQEPEPEPGVVETGAAGVLELELGLETGAAGVLELELGLEPEPEALYDDVLELADGVFWA